MLSLIRGAIKTFNSFVFNADKFECTLRVGRGLEFKVYERPGVWASDEKLAQLHADIQTIAQAGQQGKPVPVYGVLRGTRKDFENKVISVAYDLKSGKPVGLSAQSYLDIETGNRLDRVLHLGLIFVDPNLRGRNLTYLLSVLPNIVIFLKSGMRPVWVSNVSQVPAIIGLVGDNFSRVYPTPDHANHQEFEHRWIASRIMAQHREIFGVGEEAEFDLDRQIIKNAYTGGSDHLKKNFADAPKHRSEGYNSMCEQELDYKRGDDFLQLGRLDLACFLMCAQRKLEGGLKMRLASDLLFFAILGIIAPTLKWLIPLDMQVTSSETQLPSLDTSSAGGHS